MLKLTSLAIGLLTAISLAPAAQAMNASGNTPAIHQASDNLHAQIIIKVNPQILGGREHGYEHGDQYGHDRAEGYHRRQAEYARECRAREAHARWEAEQRRYREYAQRHNRHEHDRDQHRDGYHRDR